MNIQEIAEHSVDVDLLNGGACIDIGCLNFNFSTAIRDLGLNVYAFDIQKLNPPEGIVYVNAAVTTRSGMVRYVLTEDKQAMYVSEVGTEQVESVSLNSIYDLVGNNVDILKCDCEGQEYYLFSDENFKPIPKQLSIELHCHCQKLLHERFYAGCIINIQKYYTAVKNDWYEAHGAGYNYWDTLFIRNDLI